MAASPYVFDYRGRFTLAAPPPVVWGSIERGDRFESWWAWLREFRIEGGRLEDGAVLHGVVSPPVPYQMRIRVVLEQCTASSRIDATVHGDLEGNATLLLEPDGDGTEATVAWTIEMMQRPMRLAARVAHPVLRWGHDRVVDATVDGYRRFLDQHPTAGPGPEAGSAEVEPD